MFSPIVLNGREINGKKLCWLFAIVYSLVWGHVRGLESPLPACLQTTLYMRPIGVNAQRVVKFAAAVRKGNPTSGLPL